MDLNLLYASSLILTIGVTAQSIASYMRVPAILTLLPLGLLVGPVLGVLNPDAIFGAQIVPFVSFAVAIILFEGGLTLNISELKVVGVTVRNLVSIGIVVAWLAGAFAANWILGFQWPLALLLGAILVVTGPTVIGPILRQTRLNKNLGATMKWEGILNDCIGAILAVLVFEAIRHGAGEAYGLVAYIILKAVLIGGAVGAFSAAIMMAVIRYRIVPEYVHTFATLAMVVCAYSFADLIQHDSGLIAVTLMGLILGNQNLVDMKFITSFKENLTVIFVSALFIILAARVDLQILFTTDFRIILFVASLILVVRPLSVLLSSFSSEMGWREKAFLAFMAPRGIVAAAVSSVLSLKLAEHGFPEASDIFNVVFITILVTGVVYSLLAQIMSRTMNLGSADPQGVLIIGAHALAREIAKALQAQGIYVILVDSNRKNFLAAKLANLECFYGNAVVDGVVPYDSLLGVGKILGMTSNDEANSLALLHFADSFERDSLYQLRPEKLSGNRSSKHLRGRYAFGKDDGYEHLIDLYRSGAEIHSTKLSDTYTYEDLVASGDVVALFTITAEGNVSVASESHASKPKSEETIISLRKALPAQEGTQLKEAKS